MNGCDARAGAFVSGTVLPTADQVRALGADGRWVRRRGFLERARDIPRARWSRP